MSPNVPQAGNDDPLRAALRGVVRAAVESPRGTGGIGSIECRAVITLYSLLMDHPVDQWGRCRSCRRPGSVVGSRWRPCQVHSKATLCLRQLDEVLLSMLADDLGLATAPPPAAPGPAPAGDPSRHRHAARDRNPIRHPATADPDCSAPAPSPQVPQGGTVGPESRRGRG
jgi:hypothetical protein